MSKNKFITIVDNKTKIKRLLYDLVLTPRIKALEWSNITKQTPSMKVGYPGQHLASLITGIEGARTGARGDDLKDGSEVKSCSRIDQLDTCNECGGKVLRIEPNCSKCGSNNIKRMNDSKWLFSVKSKAELKLLTETVQISKGYSYSDFVNAFKGDRIDKNHLQRVLPFIDEKTRMCLPLRDTDKISEAKEAYVRRK